MAHQAEDVDRLRFHPRVAVFNDLGTGKTMTTAWWLQDLWVRGVIDSALIIAPSILYTGWREALEGQAWAPGMAELVDARPPSEELTLGAAECAGSAPFRAFFTTLTGARALAMRGVGQGTRFDPNSPLVIAMQGARVAVVVDEAQAVALATSDQGRAVRGIAGAATAVAAVTATPYGRWVHLRLWGLTALLRRDVLAARPGRGLGGPEPAPGSFDAFKSRFAALHDPMSKKGKKFSLRRAFAVDVDVDRVKAEIIGVMTPFSVRRSKAECLDLPPKVRITRGYQASAEVNRIMRQMADEDRAFLADGTVVVPANVLEEKLRVLELTGGWVMGRPVHHQKLDLQRAVLAELSEIEGPIAIWASRTREILASALVAADVAPARAQELASEACPPEAEVVTSAYRQIVDAARRAGVGIIHGPTSQGNREEIQAEWRAGRLRTVVAHPGVAGAGLNWQHVAFMIYYSTPLGVIARMQSEDRAHRHGLDHTVVYYDLTMESGPDEAVAAAHAEQRAAEAAVLEWLRNTIDHG